jgi:O-antigen/teichoic acid export membrane protein
MSEQRSVSGNITNTFIVQIPNYILGIIAGIFLTRQLGPEGKGVHTLLLTNIQFLVMILGVNLPGAIQYFVAGEKMKSSRLAGLSIVILLTGTLLVYILVFLVPFTSNKLLAESYGGLFFKTYLFVSFIATYLNAILTSFLQGNSRFREVNRLSLINSLLNFLIFTSMFYAAKNNWINAGLREALILTFFILFFNTLVLLYFFGKYIRVNWRLSISKEDSKVLLKFLIPAFISVMVNFFNNRLTIWLVENYSGVKELGYFSLALNTAQIMLMVTLSINMVLFPYFAARLDWDTAVKNFSFALKINMCIMAIGALALVLLAPVLIPLVYGEEFYPSVVPVQILAGGTFFCAQTQVFGNFLGARNKNWVNTFIYLAALLTLGTLGFFLVPDHGINGAAVASGISYFVMFTIFCIFVRIKYGIGLVSLLLINKSDIHRLKNILSRIQNKNSS